MLKSSAPTQLTVAFASGAGAGPMNAIPIPASSTSGAASWTTGFTSVNMEPIASGGIAPFGADFNGIFNALSNAQIWEQAGYLYPYSSAFATAIGGYPAGASLQMASGLGLWINQADSNSTNPDSSAGANWIELRANAGVTSIALSGASVTPTENQLGAQLLVLTGSLSAACKLVLPLRSGASWKILNNTTGGQTVTVGGATGATITVATGTTGAQEVFTDGTNYYTTSFNGAGVYLPLNGTAVAATALSSNFTIALSGAVSGSAATNGTGTVTISTTLAAVPYTGIGSVPANSLLGNPTGSVAAAAQVTLGAGLQFSSSQLQLAPTSGQVIGWLGYTPVNKAGDTMTGNLVITGGTLTLNRNSTDYNAINLINSGGVQTQLSANGNGEGELRTVTNHPLNLIVNNNGVLLLSTNGVAQFTNQIDVSTHGVNTANIVLNPPTGSSIGGSITYNHVNGDQWCTYSTAGLFNVGYTTGGGGPNPNMTITTSGSVTFTGGVTATGYNTASDETLKAGINRSAAPRDLSSVPYATWSHLRGTPVQGRGAIAQDMRGVAPEHVHEAPDGTLGIDYSLAAYEQAMFNRGRIAQLEARMARAGV